MGCSRGSDIPGRTPHPDILAVVGFVSKQIRRVNAGFLVEYSEMGVLDLLAFNIITGCISSTMDGTGYQKDNRIGKETQVRCGIKKVFSFRSGPAIFAGDNCRPFHDGTFLRSGALCPPLA